MVQFFIRIEWYKDNVCQALKGGKNGENSKDQNDTAFLMIEVDFWGKHPNFSSSTWIFSKQLIKITIRMSSKKYCAYKANERCSKEINGKVYVLNQIDYYSDT